MGVYNNYPPQILGQEWVPIREENPTLVPNYLIQEIGSSFNLNASQAITHGAFYVNDYPQNTDIQYLQMAIYQRGQEDNTGKIRRIVIPCNNATVSSTSGVLTGEPAAFQLYNLSDLSGNSNMFLGDSASKCDIWFAVNQYAQELQGKRILAVNYLYSFQVNGTLQTVTSAFNGTIPTVNLVYRNNAGSLVAILANNISGNLPMTFTTSNVERTLYRIPLGDIDPFSNSGTSPDFMPWNYTALKDFELTNGATRHSIGWSFNASTITSFGTNFWYSALEVIYCEETRSAVGATEFGLPSAALKELAIGQNLISIKHPVTRAAVTLGAGQYSVVLATGAYLATNGISPPASPVFNALRQLYSTPNLSGINNVLPFPLDDSVLNKTFSQQVTDVIPQLTVLNAGSVLGSTHPYGRQAIAPVFGAINAIQNISQNPIAGTSYNYPQVRFYARRWGDTTVPLKLSSTMISGAGQSVQITPADFDALTPEDGIIDGWKEVTLRFATAPAMGNLGTDPPWQFTAVNELSQNRWEVLGAWAPALSGVPGAASFKTSTGATQLGGATYDGSSIQLSWMSPYASGVAADSSADAVLLFSQDPPPVSGFTVTQANQSLRVTDSNCGLASCVPRALQYNQLTWNVISGAACDTFSTPFASGWGALESANNQSWTLQGVVALPNIDYEYNVANGVATVAFGSGLGNGRRASVVTGQTEFDITMDFSTDQIPVGANFSIDLLGRYDMVNNSAFTVEVQFTPAGTVTLQMIKIVTGTFTSLGPAVVLPLAYAPGIFYRLRFQSSGIKFSAKVWDRNQPEPNDWQLRVSDSTVITGTRVGTRLVVESGSTNVLPVTFSIDNFVAKPQGYGATEIQRFDPVDGQFQTIMLASNPCVNSFIDYEARVGQPSVYRARNRNVYNFAGLWSPAVTGTITSPGVTGASVSLLLFTSNWTQNGSKNLAYSAEWESSQPVEDFSFPEAATATLTRSFRRDFQTAFHGTERGGEAFQRTIVVNAVGIPPLVEHRGFQDLRDMAWATDPYICVRDETGERWFAFVNVPGGTVKRMKSYGGSRLSIATVGVVEVTGTPSVVNP